MLKLILANRWQGGMFRRSVVDKSGEVIAQLEFPRGECVEVPDKCCEAIRDAIGAALSVCSDKGKEDLPATAELIEDICEEKAALARKQSNERRTIQPDFTPAQRQVWEALNEDKKKTPKPKAEPASKSDDKASNPKK